MQIPSFLVLSASLLATLSIGCGARVVKDSNGEGGAGGGGQVVPEEWSTLIDGTWSMTPGNEGYWCATKTITEDTYIHGFRALAPMGTHHTLLLTTAQGSPDHEEPCGPTISDSMMFASGVGTDDLVFPEGVAIKIPAGTALYLNLHLFNAGGQTISGTSGTEVLVMDKKDVKHEAEMILPGTGDINLAPNSPGSAQGDCTFPEASTIVALWPHMHQFGTEMRVSLVGNQGTSVLLDAPYSFAEQKNYPMTPPLLISGGETIHYECSYINTSPNPVSWGTSSNEEMCFLGVYRYPKLAKACGM